MDFAFEDSPGEAARKVRQFAALRMNLPDDTLDRMEDSVRSKVEAMSEEEKKAFVRRANQYLNDGPPLQIMLTALFGGASSLRARAEEMEERIASELTQEDAERIVRPIRRAAKSFPEY